MTFCEHCGRPLTAGTRFCENCGAPVAAAQPEAASSPVTDGLTSSSPAGAPARRGRRRWRLVAAAVACLLVAGVIGGYVLLDREPDRPVAVTAPGGFAVRGPAAAFPDGEPVLAVSQREDRFLAAFGLDKLRRVVSVTADGQPQRPVEVVLPYDPATVPEGAVPAVFYFDEDADLWLPVETEADPVAGQLIGTTDHFTDFAAGLLDGLLDVALTVTNRAATGVDWLAYQVADTTGARAEQPKCGPRPDWVTGLQTTHEPGFRLSAALFGCPEVVEGNPDRLRVRIAVNRAYGFELTADPPAARIDIEPTPDLTGALGNTFSARFRSEDGTVIAPGTATVLMEFDRPAEARHLVIDAHMTAASTLIDALMLSLDVGSVFATGDPTEKVEAFECGVALIKGRGDIETREVMLGTWSKVVTDCLGPAASGLGEVALRKLGASISVALSMGQVGQSAMDRQRDLLNGVRLQVGVVPAGTPTTAGFSGRWEGPVPQPFSVPYSTVANLVDSAGVLSATVTYPGLDCSGRWTQVSRSAAQAELTETIAGDPSFACVPSVGIRLTLLGDGRLLVTYSSGQQESFDAVLTRTGPPESLADEVAAQPAGAVFLSDVLVASGGAGPSGNLVSSDASISGKVAAHTTSQWVGCDGTSAWAEYSLDGRTRLTGWLGYRDFAEPDLLAAVRVFVDDRLVTTLEVGLAGSDVDLELPSGQRLRMEASLVSGSCGAHSEGYLAWGNGALS